MRLMLLSYLVKLDATPEQARLLVETMRACNRAAGCAAEVAFEHKTAGKRRVQRFCYYELRERFGISAQMAVRAIAKACGAYKRDKQICPQFRPLGAVAYDRRILTWRENLDAVSIATLAGRIEVPVVGGDYLDVVRAGMLRGEAKLICRGGEFFLAVAVEVAEPAAPEADVWLGVDLGIVNLAVDSDGETFEGTHLNGLRYRHARLRQRLQKKGTKSAKRLLQKRRRREARHARNVNHVIAKKVVAKAEGTGRGIALEDLGGIRSRTTVRKAQRRSHHSWAFGQLRKHIEYKAERAGIEVIAVDPANTSRTCPACGYCARKNRKNRNDFVCRRCGLAGPADHIAACNIVRVASLWADDYRDGVGQGCSQSATRGR